MNAQSAIRPKYLLASAAAVLLGGLAVAAASPSQPAVASPVTAPSLATSTHKPSALIPLTADQARRRTRHAHASTTTTSSESLR